MAKPYESAQEIVDDLFEIAEAIEKMPCGGARELSLQLYMKAGLIAGFFIRHSDDLESIADTIDALHKN